MTDHGINIPVISPSNDNLYAIDTGSFVSTSDTDITQSCIEITNYLKSVNVYSDHTDASPISTDANAYSIHWAVLKNYIIPDANAFIDNELKMVYYTPLHKTEVTNSKYSRQIVKLAALYCAWRLETRDYPGGGMPSDSPYAQSLKAILDAEILKIQSGGIRLRGQRLKSANGRFCNPHIEPYKPSTPAAAPMINPTNPTM